MVSASAPRFRPNRPRKRGSAPRFRPRPFTALTAIPAMSALLLQLHEQDIVGESDRLLNGWTVAFFEGNFVRYRLTE
jgi:hypothetical protein